MNKYGWRDLDFSEKQTSNRTRILVIGDSFVFGAQATLFQTFPKICQTILNHRGLNNIQVIQMGEKGFGLVHYQNVMLESLKYSPDYIVISFFPWNDIVDMSSFADFSQPIPEFKTSYLKNLEDNFDKSKMEGISLQNASRAGFSEDLREKSRLFNVLHKYLGIITSRIKLGIENPNIEVLETGFKIYIEPSPPSVVKAYHQIEKILSVMKRKADDNKCELIFLMLPCAGQIYPELAKKEEYEFRKRFKEIPISEIDHDKPNKKLEEICRENEIIFLSPLDYCREYVREFPYQKLFLNADNAFWWGHFTSTGNELMGAWLSQKFYDIMSGVVSPQDAQLRNEA